MFLSYQRYRTTLVIAHSTVCLFMYNKLEEIVKASSNNLLKTLQSFSFTRDRYIYQNYIIGHQNTYSDIEIWVVIFKYQRFPTNMALTLQYACMLGFVFFLNVSAESSEEFMFIVCFRFEYRNWESLSLLFAVRPCCYWAPPACGGEPSLSSSQDEDVNPAGAEIEWGAVVWPSPW